MRALLVGLALIVACGGAHPRPPEARPAPTAAAPRATEVAVAAPDETECDALFAHVVALGADDARSAQLTAEDRTRVVAEIRTRYLASCRAMTRAAFQCALDAASLAAVDACGG